MISAYWILLFSAVIGVLIGWIMSDKTDIKEVRKVCKIWEGYYWEETERLIGAVKEIHQRNEQIKSLNFQLALARDKTPKEPHKIIFEAELNTEQLEKDMEKLKRLIGTCKHQDNCTFYEIGEDSHISR
jgi:hypothetical protein